MIIKRISKSRVLITLLFSFCAAIPVHADDIKVSLVPPVIEKMVKPGTHIQDAISFTNLGTLALAVLVDTADFAFDEKGEVTDQTPGTEPTSLAPYIRVTPISIVVPPQQKVYFRYTIEAPEKFSQLRAKVYFSCTPIVGLGGANRVMIVPRLGVAVYVENTDAKPASLDVSAVRFERSKEKPDQLILNIDVANSGERNIRPKGYLEVESKDGQFSHSFIFNDGKEPMLPGQARKWQMQFGPVSKQELSLKLNFTTSFRNSFESKYSIPAFIEK